MKYSKLNNCYLYVLNTMADWEIAHITAELNSGRFLKNGNVTIRKVSKNLNTVTSMGGMSVNVDLKLSEVEFSEGDLLILPGGNEWMDEEHNSILPHFRADYSHYFQKPRVCHHSSKLDCDWILPSHSELHPLSALVWSDPFYFRHQADHAH